jgi:hypothetical protein
MARLNEREDAGMTAEESAETLPDCTPEAPKPKKAKKIALIALVAVVAACGVLAASGAMKKTPFEDALGACEVPDSTFFPELGASIKDDGKTLILNHKGEEEKLGLSIDDFACVLLKLELPSSITAKMDSTRAMDGRQSGSWDDFEISWAYHPDDGLDTIITRK